MSSSDRNDTTPPAPESLPPGLTIDEALSVAYLDLGPPGLSPDVLRARAAAWVRGLAATPPAPDRGAVNRSEPPPGIEVFETEEGYGHTRGPWAWRWKAEGHQSKDREEATADAWDFVDSLTAPAEARAREAERERDQALELHARQGERLAKLRDGLAAARQAGREALAAEVRRIIHDANDGPGGCACAFGEYLERIEALAAPSPKSTEPPTYELGGWYEPGYSPGDARPEAAPMGGTPEPKGVPHAMTPSWWPTTVDRIECDDCGLPFEPYDQVRAVAWSHVVCPDGPRPEGLETAPESPAAPSEPAGCTCAGDGVPFHHGSCPEAAPKSTEPAASEDDDEPDDAVLCDGCSKARPVERVAFGEDAITCDECSAKMAAEAASMGGTPEPTCAHPEGDRECGATLPCGRHPWENADQPEPPAAPTEPEPDSPKPAPAQPKRYVTGAELERVHDAAEALREAASSYAEAVELGDPQNTEDAKWLASADEHLLTCARTWVASLPAAAAPQGAGPVLAPEKRYALRDRSLEANDRIDALSPSEVR